MSELVTVHDLTREMLRISRLIDEAIEDLTQETKSYARKKNDHMREKAKHYLLAEGKTVSEREARRDEALAESEVAYEAELSEGLMKAKRLTIEARLGQLSALQSRAAALKAEMQMAGR